MKALVYSSSFLLAIAVNLNSVLAQTTTFTHEEITYSVALKESRGQNLTFSLSYPKSNGNTHTVEYQGICGTNIIGVLGETVVNTEGKVISEKTSTQAMFFDLNSSREWEMSGAIRQALNLMCVNN